MIEKKVVVNLAVGISARRRLDEFARSTGLPLGVVLERAIMAYEPGASVALNEPRITALESRIEALESALAALKEQVAIIYQPEPEGAENGSCAVTEPLVEPGIVEAAETADDDTGDMVESPKETDRMENEAEPSPSIPPLPKQPLPPIESAIKELGRQGHGQQAIANELNRRGYRTANGTLIRRGYVNNRLKSLGL